jgi:protein O-GlcNAc transferase
VIQFYAVARAIRPETAHELAHALDERGRGDEALVIFEELTRLRPDHSRHWMCLATQLKESGDHAAAHAAALRGVEAGRAAVGRAPNHAEARSTLGSALLVAGNVDEAMSECREAIRLKPALAEAHLVLGMTLVTPSQLEPAIVEYREAIRLKPNLALAHCHLGLALKSQGKFAEAVAEYRAALRLQPDFAEARYGLADALRDDGPPDLVTAELRETIWRKPDVAEAHAVLGGIYCHYGENRAALIEFRRAHDLGSKRKDWTYQTEPRALAVKNLEHWKADPDLAGVRGGAALRGLPTDERNAWKRLWDQVDEILKLASVLLHF